jgi:plastocyanin
MGMGMRMQICSAVQFRPHHPWEVMSGGLDCRMLRWDYGSGRVRHSWSMAEAQADDGEDGVHLFNPPMVHSIAVGGTDDHLSQRVVAVARGDGAVVVYDVAAAASTRSGARKGARRGEGTRAGKGGGCGGASPSGRPRSVTAQLNGHAASATHVAFARFSGGRHLVSGGNDAQLVLWDWAAAAEAEAEAEQVENKAVGIAGVDLPGVQTVAHGDKVNWLCTSTDRSHAVFVADTSPQLSMYALAA